MLSAPSFAQTNEAIEASHRVNMAGRQRMLSQRMSKAACFIQNGVNTDAHMQMLRDSFVLFSSSHNALRYGDKRDRLMVEKIPAAIDVLAIVDQKWYFFSIYVEATLYSGSINRNQMIQIDQNGLALLGKMNEAVNVIASGHAELLPDLPLLLSITIDVAGRQRMLSQKATKELCLIDSGIDVEANREKLNNTIHQFSNVLDALITGQEGIVIAPPNAEVQSKLNEVKSAWQDPQVIFAKIASGQTLSSKERQMVIEQMETVLKTMNQAVGMYELRR